MKKTVNRRDMIKNAAKTTVGAVAGSAMAFPANATPINPDAKLITLYGDLVNARAAMEATYQNFPTFDKAAYASYSDDELEVVFDAAWEKYHALEAAILPIAAHTPEGINIKLDIWMEHQSPRFPEGTNWVDRFVASALDDLQRIAPIDTTIA